MSKEAMKLALEALAVKFSEGWHEGIKIDASDIMLLNDAAQALAEQPAQHTWVGLTDKEKSDIWCVMTNRDFVTEDTHVYADVIEAKLKEKNT